MRVFSSNPQPLQIVLFSGIPAALSIYFCINKKRKPEPGTHDVSVRSLRRNGGLDDDSPSDKTRTIRKLHGFFIPQTGEKPPENFERTD